MIASTSPPERLAALDEEERFDAPLFGQLAEMGILGIGTAEGNIRDQTVVVEELAAGPTSMAVYVIVHYMAAHLLSTATVRGHRSNMLEQLIDGDLKVAFALTEPGGGTDVAAAMKTRATPDGDDWILSGSKMWISGASQADVLIVLARTATSEGSPIDGITMFLVDGGAAGLKTTPLATLSIHGLDTSEVFLDDVRVGKDDMLGDIHMGFRQVLDTLNEERINAAAAAIGIGRGALELAVEYASERTAFGKAIGSFQALQHRLVDAAIALEAARGLMVRAAEVEAAGGRADLLSSMAKIAASEAAIKATTDAMQVFGGAAFARGIAVQRHFRDARLYTFAPISNEMARNHLGERFLGFPRSF